MSVPRQLYECVSVLSPLTILIKTEFEAWRKIHNWHFRRMFAVILPFM